MDGVKFGGCRVARCTCTILMTGTCAWAARLGLSFSMVLRHAYAPSSCLSILHLGAHGGSTWFHAMLYPYCLIRPHFPSRVTLFKSDKLRRPVHFHANVQLPDRTIYTHNLANTGDRLYMHVVLAHGSSTFHTG